MKETDRLQAAASSAAHGDGLLPRVPPHLSTLEERRPLSPHLTIYRPQLTSVLSILHRLTGIFLGSGAVMLCWWLLSAAAGPSYYAAAMWFLTSWLGYVLLFAWTFSLFYHLCNGIRHLGWDIGVGYSLRAAYASGALAVGGALGLTGLSWGVGLALYLTR
jgi:succinate dehydrogenase / fumarate reductase cytochrome b subunit